MALLLELLGYSWWSYLVLVLILVISSLALLNNYIYSYWQRKGLISVAGSLPFGSLKDFVLARKSIGEVYADIYKKGEGHPVIGYYSFLSPALVICDPELVRNVLVKNYDHFSDRGIYSNRKIDPLSAHLFSTDGAQYRQMRYALSPTYSDSKLRYLFETMQACSSKLCEYLCETVGASNSGRSLVIKEITNTYGLNVIASTAVGIEHHSFTEQNPLADAALQVTDPNNLMQGLRFTLSFVSPKTASFFNMRFTPKGVSDFYIDLIEKIVAHRKVNNVLRKDFMQVLLNLNAEIEKSNDGRRPLTLEEMAAQTFLFILAGHESTSAALCFLLYALALDAEIQQKLHREIDAMNGNINYENLRDLEYLEMVFCETLRKYTPAPVLIRLCVKDYTLPDGFVIEKGTQVIIPVYGLHTDPKLFPEPEKFDPERFSKKSPSHIVQPFSYLPFGEGPRYCIGKKFGMAAVKLALISILSKFRVERAADTKVPMEIERSTFVINPYKGLTLKLVPRSF